MPESMWRLAAEIAADQDAVACGDVTANASALVIGPSAVVSAVGMLVSGNHIPASPTDAWPRATVDVAIPLRRDQASIVYCLAGLHAQTHRPRRIALVDDGRCEPDGTLVLAREFGAANGVRIELLQLPRRDRDAGHAALASLFDGDALLVLDGQTVLDSPDYLEHCLLALHEGPSVASACGATLPLRDGDRRAWARSDAFRRWVGRDEYRDPCAPRGELQRLGRWLGDTYRESVGLVQQRVLHRGHMRAFGSIAPPLGAVLYRRAYLARLDLGPSPDAGSVEAGLRLGFALANEGYRAVQRPEVIARTRPSALSALPRRRARHARAFLRQARRFGALLRMPLRRAPGVPVAHDLRRVREPFREAFGTDRTRRHGRRVGWILACTAAEKLVLPVLGLVLLAVGGWPWLARVAAIELALWLLALAIVAPSRPVATALKGLVVAPLRYVETIADAVGAVGFLLERRR